TPLLLGICNRNLECVPACQIPNSKFLILLRPRERSLARVARNTLRNRSGAARPRLGCRARSARARAVQIFECLTVLEDHRSFFYLTRWPVLSTLAFM